MQVLADAVEVLCLHPRRPRPASPLGTHGRGRQACPSQVWKIGCVVAAVLVGAVEMRAIACCACAISVYLVHPVSSNDGRVIAISCISVESN